MSIIHSTTEEEATLAALLASAADSADLSFVEELLAGLAGYRSVNPSLDPNDLSDAELERMALEQAWADEMEEFAADCERVFRGRGL